MKAKWQVPPPHRAIIAYLTEVDEKIARRHGLLFSFPSTTF
jgi:hypothetical protein